MEMEAVSLLYPRTFLSIFFLKMIPGHVHASFFSLSILGYCCRSLAAFLSGYLEICVFVNYKSRVVEERNIYKQML